VNQTLLRIVRAAVGVVVLFVLLTTVRGWWAEYKAAPRPVVASAETSASVNATQVVPVKGTLIVTMEGLNLRDKPAIDGDQIRALKKNEKLTLLAKQGDWYQVSTSKEEEGWISANKSYTKLQKK
jgi:uncharacterized protein YgiM (DUF1202 family)